MCNIWKMSIPTYVLHMEKWLSVACVTHEKLFSRLDELHMFIPTIWIWLVSITYITLIIIITSGLL